MYGTVPYGTVNTVYKVRIDSRERIVAVKGNSLEKYFSSEAFETIAMFFNCENMFYFSQRYMSVEVGWSD